MGLGLNGLRGSRLSSLSQKQKNDKEEKEEEMKVEIEFGHGVNFPGLAKICSFQENRKGHD